MFHNAWSYKKTENSYVASNHFFDFKVSQSSPLLYIAVMAAVIASLNGFLPIRWLKLIDGVQKISVLEVDEDLPNFFDAIVVEEAKSLKIDNEHI